MASISATPHVQCHTIGCGCQSRQSQQQIIASRSTRGIIIFCPISPPRVPRPRYVLLQVVLGDSARCGASYTYIQLPVDRHLDAPAVSKGLGLGPGDSVMRGLHPVCGRRQSRHLCLQHLQTAKKIIYSSRVSPLSPISLFSSLPAPFQQERGLSRVYSANNPPFI
jgi:hypothetical protein